MKFQTALLFAAAASFAFAQVSDVEDDNKAELTNAQESEVEPADNTSAEDTPAASDNTPVETVIDATNPDDQTAEDNKDEAKTEENPDEAKTEENPDESKSEEKKDEAEGSDDYDEVENATDAAEGSDDYDETNVDGNDVPSGAAEDSESDDEDGVDSTTIAAGAGAAAAAAAGIFIWVKRSKQDGLEKVDNLRNQFNMA